jgi:hypothetical protein
MAASGGEGVQGSQPCEGRRGAGRREWPPAGVVVALLILVLWAPAPSFGQPDAPYAPSTAKKGDSPAGGAGAKGRQDGPEAKGDQKQKLREEGRGLFAGGEGGPGGDATRVGGDGKGSLAASAAWTIVLKAYREQDEPDAAAGLARVRAEGGLPEAYLEKRGEATVIAYGRYATPEEGQKDLSRVHAIEVMLDGERVKPFAGAFLAPPAAVKGSIPEYDLRNARRLKGDWALYTLQIGVYSREDKPATAREMEEFRAAAEKAVVQLRREGEQAYYYHGPTRSMVTVGLFGKEDFDAASRLESPALKALRKKFPYNLQNGAGVKRRVILTDPKTGRQFKQEKLEQSGLVHLPKDEQAGR